MKRFLFIILMLGLITACESNAEIDTIPPSFKCNSKVSYSTDISPLLSQNCKPCHFTGGQFPDLSTYSSVSQNADLIGTVTQNKTMPKGGSLTQEEIDKIACWVDNGALNN